MNNPNGISIDASGNIYIADFANSRIRKVSTSGVITTIAGNGTAGLSGDGGQATAAEFDSPFGVAIDATGNLYISDNDGSHGGGGGNSRIRKVNSVGIINTFAGINGSTGFSGDGGQATAAKLLNPIGVATDAMGNLYIADMNNTRVRKVSASGIITTVAGNGTYGYSGDGGQATAAELESPYGLAIDAVGNLYIADYSNNRIRKVNTSGVISTIAGNGTASFSGDGGQASSAELNSPWGLVCDAAGNLYIADLGNSRVRRINTSGIISTVAGNGTVGYSGDGGQATSAEMYNPSGVALDATGNLYICDLGGNRIRKVTFPACTANAGPNIIDYDDGSEHFTVCAAMPIGTASVTGQVYTWSPITALSCTNCAQPNTSYDNITTPIIYTVTVNGTGCTTVTSTVQVTTHATPTLAVTLRNLTATAGRNITAVGTYTGNTTPNNYYWEIDQCDQFGTILTGPGTYSWSAWTAGAPVGTFTFANTSTLTCDNYYKITFAVQNTNGCLGWVPTDGVIQITPANAGPNVVDVQNCTGWPGKTIGTASVTGMSYTWSPATALSCTNCAQPTSTWSNTSTAQIYTLTVSGGGCTTATSTVQVSAQTNPCPGCCTGRFTNTTVPEINSVPALSVFPNPSNGNVTVSISAYAEYIRISDMQGRLIYETKDIAAGELKVDISEYTKGMYFIFAKTADTVEKQKLIIE